MIRWWLALLAPPAAAIAVGVAGGVGATELGFSVVPAIAIAITAALSTLLVAVEIWTPHEDGRDG